jgi:tetratricopeptide (TPR) repeat protein
MHTGAAALARNIAVGVPLRPGRDYMLDLSRAYEHYHRGALDDCVELATNLAPLLPKHDRHSRGLVSLLDANVAARRCGIFDDDVAVPPGECDAEAVTAASDRFATTAEVVAEDCGETDSRLGAIYLNHGILWLQAGGLVEAEKYLAASLTVLSRCFTEDHIVAADAHHNMAALLERRGDAEAAKAHYVQSLKIRSKFDDPRRAVDAALIDTMTCLAMLSWTAEGDVAGCLRQLQKAIPLARRLPKRADTDLTLATLLTHSGAAALALNSPAKARAFLVQALPLWSSRLGGRHPRTLRARALWDAAEESLRVATTSH